MSASPTPLRSHVTLALGTILHAFTHAYGTLLVPLYLLIRDDLRLPGVQYASLVVALYGFVYCAFSYVGGVLADRADRRVLLGVGLLGNAAAILLMGLTRRYEILLLLGFAAGLAGTLFHPAANALMPAHYPRSPGLAIGWLGVGSGLGFFVGPQYAGWRSQTQWWRWGTVADWQRPCVELGALGLAVGVVFLLLAREARPASPMHQDAPKPALGPTMRRRVLAVAFALACRDFSGVASLSLVSLFLQKAYGRDARHAGSVVGAMMLIGVVVNPLAVWLSPGSKRLPALALVLVVGGLFIAMTPFVGQRWLLVALWAFQACHLGSYAISDAAIMERVPPEVRGRVVGLFLTVAGTIASTAPWVMGAWVDHLGDRARTPTAYVGLFGAIGLLIALAAVSSLAIRRLSDHAIDPTVRPSSEIMPRTLEPVG